MIAYLETSALVKLVVEEPGTDIADRIWAEADRSVVSLLAYPETRAALAAAHRLQRIDRPELKRSKARLERLWREVDVFEVTMDVARVAGDCCERHGLRGHDAVHLATALALDDAALVVASWDKDLRDAARQRGLAVAPAAL